MKVRDVLKAHAAGKLTEDEAVEGITAAVGVSMAIKFAESQEREMHQHIEARRAGVQLALLVLERWAALRRVEPELADKTLRDLAEAAFAHINIYHWEADDIHHACETLADGWFGSGGWRWENEEREIILSADGTLMLDTTQEWPEPEQYDPASRSEGGEE